MYIFIEEDGRPFKADEISDEARESHEAGILTIINADDCTQMDQEGDWVEVPDLDY